MEFRPSQALVSLAEEKRKRKRESERERERERDRERPCTVELLIKGCETVGE